MSLDVSSFFQAFISSLLSDHDEVLRGVHESWIRAITLETDKAGCLAYLVLDVHVPPNVKPQIRINFGKAEEVFERGRIVYRKYTIRVKLQDRSNII